MIEHRLIEKFLAFAAESTAGMSEDSYDPVLIDTIVDFIKTYADRTHHGKEEDILFRELARKRLPKDDVDAMNELIEQHKQAREKVAEIVALNAHYRHGKRAVVSKVKEIVLWLSEFYPTHIRKEDKEFFPKSERHFRQEELDSMLEEFARFDRKMIHEKYQELYSRIRGQTRTG